MNKFSNPGTEDQVSTVQANTLKSLLSAARLFRLAVCTQRYGAGAYSVDELLTDAKKGVWGELATGAVIDPYRRNLQKQFVQSLIALINPEPPTQLPGFGNLPRGLVVFTGDIRFTDVPSIARAQLAALRTEIGAAIARESDKVSRYHLQDVSERIRVALNPVTTIK